jgi:aminopeptidase
MAGVDPRIEAYAKLLVERSLDVQPGWQVWINSSRLARPLVEEVVRAIARRGAYPLVRLGGEGMEDVPFETIWALEAPEEALAEVAPADRHAWETMDAWMNIGAPENTAAGLDLSPERRLLLAKGRHAMRMRRLSDEIPWVACRFPTPALAQDSRMSLKEFEDFLYGACLLDWDAEGERMAKIKERFDRASEVRIVGAGTDLTLSLEGRKGEVDAGHANMPGGEVYYCPVEDATEGVVHFSEFPAFQAPDEIEGVRMVYRSGRVVEASATRGEEILVETLDRDDGARVLGELGIGCNPGIQRYMRNTLFDEKIDGTVHLAIGAGFPQLGSRNESVVHWDMVKDLRSGGQLLCDGEVVQENGSWLI